MTPDNQILLDAIREVAAHVERLETRVDTIDARTSQIAGDLIREVATHVERLETRVDTIDTRTSQIAGDLRDLRDRVPLIEERIDNGFRALKSDLNFAFSDIRKISTAQERGDKTIDMLKRELASLQQRLAAIEGGHGATQT